MPRTAVASANHTDLYFWPVLRLLSFDAASPAQFVKLLNDPFVRKHMPLSTIVDEEWCAGWIEIKQRLWDPSGERGPWSVWVGDQFAGWAGIQPDEEFESGLALVLHKRYWGSGREVLKLVLEKAITQRTANLTVIEFPHSRNAGLVLKKLGFEEVDEVEIHEVRFRRYFARISELVERL